LSEIIIFFGVTLVLALVSRKDLSKPGVHGYAHGYYRFFAWECMLGLFVLNMHVWYDNYYSSHQLVSGLFFFGSLLLAVSGLWMLHREGKQNAKRDDVPMWAFEKTTSLVTNGIYRFIRHPMYSSLLLLCWGIFFKQPSLPGSVLAISASIFVLVAAHVEEKESQKYFGEAYWAYMKRSKMFVPFIL